MIAPADFPINYYRWPDSGACTGQEKTELEKNKAGFTGADEALRDGCYDRLPAELAASVTKMPDHNISVFKIINTIGLYKYKMNKQHITNSSASNGKEHLSFPEMYCGCCRYGDKFRKAVVPLQKIYISKTVYNKHAKYSGREIVTDILNKFRGFSIFR